MFTDYQLITFNPEDFIDPFEFIIKEMNYFFCPEEYFIEELKLCGAIIEQYPEQSSTSLN